MKPGLNAFPRSNSHFFTASWPTKRFDFSKPSTATRKNKGRLSTPSRIDWKPYPGPQTDAYNSDADELLFGGAAGGGKSDILLGLAFTKHKNSVIYRREYPQLEGLIDRSKEIVGTETGFTGSPTPRWNLPGRRVAFGAVQHEKDKEKQQGRPRDLIGFDELAHFTRSQYQFLTAWNRSSVPGQRCRIVGATNPPVPGQEGNWILELWAPWLDEEYPKNSRFLGTGAVMEPAGPGELRWYAMLAGELYWVESGESFEWTDPDGQTETIRPKSRTFIPAKVTDNPTYRDSGYIATLQALPEPLRSLLLHGKFNVAIDGNPWQVIPTLWVLAAQERFKQRDKPDVALTCIGLDVAHGGGDKTVAARRYGDWFAPLVKAKGTDTPDGKSAAAICYQEWESGAYINVDAIGYGASAHERLSDRPPEGYGLKAYAVNVAASDSDKKEHRYKDKSGKYVMRNLRAEMHWRLREALDPENGQEMCLPDDRELLTDLCAATYEITPSGILVESKEAIKLRLNRSPDCGEAVLLSMLPPAEPPALPPMFSGSYIGNKSAKPARTRY